MKTQFKRLTIWGFVAFLIIGVSFSLLQQLTKKPEQKDAVSALLAVTSADHIKGPENASVTLIEYGDFQCPSCLSYYPYVIQLTKDFPTMLRMVYRNFPITTIHANAIAAAQTAEAASKQGKFWEMHNVLFENQSTWASERNPEVLFIQYAKQIGLDSERFKNDMNSSAVSNKIKNDQDSGTALDVQGTPTFFLNGREIENPKGYIAFKTLITAELLK